MRITATGLPELPAAAHAPETSPDSGSTPAVAAGAAAPALKSAVLQPALAALRDMPDVDHAKIEAVREALARGEAPFNPARLAALIERYHGNRE